MAIGAAAGAALLLVTPTRAFEWVVPFLVALGSAVLLLRSRNSARRRTRREEQPRRALPVGLFAVAAHNGYFGAGSGIMMLALLMLTVEENLPRANAFKNVLLLAGEVVVAAGFIVFGSVQWAAVVPLAIGFLIGGAVGPSVARRVPADKLQIWIALAGLALATWLLVVAIRG
ncbi:putative membrane protein YfcA [Nakamurella sp. UYEF19]|uniref:sulfite exporter TauE/SafE family protein n=1 Tax=Nakamurella sp. UYEF19 TaxID=1756392 RepID=UPI0033917E04